MPDYNNGKIYKIVCNLTKECYVGSTTQPLSKRLTQHVTEYNRCLLGKSVATSSFPILERGNYDIVLLEEVKCDNKEQLHKEERKHIEANVCVNHNIPTRTKYEYAKVNKDKIIKYKNDYREANKDSVAEYQRNYRKVNKERGKEYQKSYIQVNKVYLVDYHKKYHEANKDEINKRRREANANKKSKLII